MYQFELEKGSKKYICPACSQKRFVRYVKRQTFEHLDTDVGRCDRESSCGYHFTPKMYFAENPQTEFAQIAHYKKKGVSRQSTIQTNGIGAKETAQNTKKRFDFIPFERFAETLTSYDQNAFVQFLFDLFPDCEKEIEDVLKMYFVGTFEDYTCFPSIDRKNRICRAKLIRFDQKTGKRKKGKYDTSSLPAKLKLKNDFRYKQIFFGEHLLTKYPNKMICIVEAEKTAIIAALCLPDFVWLGCNSKTWLNSERIKRFGRNRKIILYPDADGFEEWNKKAQTARNNGFDVTISKLIQHKASDHERKDGYDLADYLINEQTEINEQNKYIASVNRKIETVKNDADLFEQFNTILDEQKAILIIDGECSETEAEAFISNPENVRSVIMSL